MKGGILELFRQCGILELFRQCGILELFRQCGIFGIVPTAWFFFMLSHPEILPLRTILLVYRTPPHSCHQLSLFRSEAIPYHFLFLSYKHQNQSDYNHFSLVSPGG